MAQGKGNEYPSGRGILKCGFCEKPYRDHELGPPCPEAPPGALSHRPSLEARIRRERL
jgi:hypothetical protein